MFFSCLMFSHVYYIICCNLRMIIMCKGLHGSLNSMCSWTHWFQTMQKELMKFIMNKQFIQFKEKQKIRRDNAHGIVQFHWSIKNLNMKVFKSLPSTSKLEQNLLSFTFIHTIIFNFANLLHQFYFPKDLPMLGHCWHLWCYISTPCSWFVLNPCFF